MKETILKIEEVFNINYKDGYKITTSKQEILILIDSSQQCCETWGYIISEDNPKDFIGAEISKIEAVQNCEVKELENLGTLCSVSAEFVSIHTSKGLLQFTVYNAHNGYYGHEVHIKFDNIIINEVL